MNKPIQFLALVTMLLFICLLFPEALPAQPSPPTPPAATPIDGGLSLLAVAGGAYAIKKLRGSKE